MDNWLRVAKLLVDPTLQSLYMVVLSTVAAVAMGLPLGIVLVLVGPGGLSPKPLIYRALDGLINLFRSFPFIVLMVLLFPLSRLIVGTTIGTTATVVPLSIAATPLVGRLVENALRAVDRGVVEAAVAMGSDLRTIVVKVLIPEALPSLVTGLTLTVINVVGYSAMAGAIGGGGLGDLAIRYGLHRFQTQVLAVAVAVIILLVQSIQWTGNALARYIARNR